MVFSRRSVLRTSARLVGLGAAAGLALLDGCQLLSPPAPTPAAMRRIGFLYLGIRSVLQPYMDAFRDRLHQLSWVEGDNLAIEWRFADGNAQRLPELAAELVQLPVEVIVAVGVPAVLPAEQQTSTIPIVGVHFDAVEYGLAKSYSRPGGNVTGITYGDDTISTKRVELLKTVLPQLSRLAILANPTLAAYTMQMTPAARTAQSLAIQVLDLDVRRVEDVDSAFAAAHEWGAEGLLVLGDADYTAGVNARVAELAAQTRVPVIGANYAVPDNGLLMSFSPNFQADYRQGAEYVDKMLRGASPADLPIQEPREWEFIINVQAAKALGLTIPPDAAAQVTQWVQ